MGIIHYILNNAAHFPDKTALVLDNQTLTYAQVVERTRKLSGALSLLGVGDGVHVGLLLGNSLEFVIILLAAADLGATVVPMDSSISNRDLITAINATDIKYIIGQNSILKKAFQSSQQGQNRFPLLRKSCIALGGHIEGCYSFSKIQETVSKSYKLGVQSFDDEQDFILTMTSGSTNDPKPIVFTQGTKISRCFNAQEVYKLTEEDRVLVATPLYHSISQRLIFLPLILGGTCVIMRTFNENKWIGQVSKNKITFTIAVASQLEAILERTIKSDQNIESLRCVVSCCALLNDTIKKRLIGELKCAFHECYGTSEVGVISNLSDNDPSRKMHTVGRAVPGVDIRIVDNKRNIVVPGKVGEIACKSSMCFSRYYKKEQETQNSLVDGFFYTGDMGYLDEDGYLVFSGRLKEVIITGGTNVYPKDIEAVLNEHAKVKECAVIGVADKHFGEAVLALIIKNVGAKLTERDLQRYCLDRLADVQKPLAYIFVDDFPRTALGKTLKYKLAQQYADYDLTADLRSIIKSRI